MDFDKKKCFNLLEILLIHEIYYLLKCAVQQKICLSLPNVHNELGEGGDKNEPF